VHALKEEKSQYGQSSSRLSHPNPVQWKWDCFRLPFLSLVYFIPVLIMMMFLILGFGNEQPFIIFINTIIIMLMLLYMLVGENITLLFSMAFEFGIAIKHYYRGMDGLMHRISSQYLLLWLKRKKWKA
jgi:hypothetical protein